MHWIKVQLQQIKKEVQQLVIEMIENLMKFLDCWACMGVSLINDSSNFKYSCNIPKFNPSFSNGKGGKQYLMDILWELRFIQIYQLFVGIMHSSGIIFAIALLPQRIKFRAKGNRMKLPEMAVNRYFEHSFFV